jgi:hypothetical protein
MPAPAEIFKRRPWSEEDGKFLTLSWETGVAIKEVCDELGRTREAVQLRARRLGLKRSEL